MSRVSELRVGNFIKISKDTDNNIYYVDRIDYSMQGRGSSSYELDMSVVSGPQIGKNNIKKRMSSSDKIDILFVEEREFTFLYSTEDDAMFIDYNNMEEISIDLKVIGRQYIFLEEGMLIKIIFCEQKPIFVKIPEKIEVEIVEADPAIKGQTAAASSKSAIIKNNIKITVPQFIKSGDRIIISTKDFSYVSRV